MPDFSCSRRITYFIAGVFSYGALIPLMCVRYAFLRRAFDRIGLSLAWAGLALGFLLVSTLHDWSVFAALPQTAGLREPLTVV